MFQFYNQNLISIEFFLDCFVVKDLSTKVSLIQEPNNGHVHEWSSSLTVNKIVCLPHLQVINQPIASSPPSSINKSSSKSCVH